MSPAPLELEVRDHIFCDPSFVQHFLAGDRVKLQAVVQRCHKSSLFNRRRWTIPKLKPDTRLYLPIQRILNTIKEAVDTSVTPTTNSSFLHREPSAIESDCELSFLTQPDLVIFDKTYERYERWENIRTTIRVVPLESHLKAAITGLAFDARAVFAHQIHRRHLYALAVCGTEATFVRFDRAGVLYSAPIDVRGDSDGFTKAVAALLMMDSETFGYDPIFTTKMGGDRLEYYVDLPKSALEEPRSAGQTADKSPAVRFKAIELLCHRKDIIGRATIVLRIQQVKTPNAELDQPALKTRGQKRKFEESQLEELYDESFVLKLIWRDPSQESEGEALKQLVGMYGLVQYAWHGDASRSCKRCLASSRCGDCVDETPEVKKLLVCKNLTDIQGAVEMTGVGDEYTPKSVNTKRLERASNPRKSRIYSRILLSSVGKSLWAAESPKQLLMGILDAIMGCWRLVNMDILHRDISGGNILLLSPGQHMRWREWKEPVEGGTEDPTQSELKLREYLDRFGRDPTGVLSDFDMYLQLSDSESSSSAKSESGGSSSTGNAENSVRYPRISLAPSPELYTRVENDAPHAKRRRTGSSYIPVPVPMPVSVPVPVPSASPKRVYRTPRRWRFPCYVPSVEKVDYRVGTTSFMSTNVLNVALGEKYDHSFMDDLESFFWVLFYTVVGHAKPGVNTLNSSAVEMLDRMDDENMGRVRAFKVGCLTKCCRNPEKMIKQLQSTENGWTHNEALVGALIQLGSFFFDDGDVPLSHLTPVDAFPKVVDIFVDALQKMEES